MTRSAESVLRQPIRRRLGHLLNQPVADFGLLDSLSYPSRFGRYCWRPARTLLDRRRNGLAFNMGVRHLRRASTRGEAHCSRRTPSTDPAVVARHVVGVGLLDGDGNVVVTRLLAGRSDGLRTATAPLVRADVPRRPATSEAADQAVHPDRSPELHEDERGSAVTPARTANDQNRSRPLSVLASSRRLRWACSLGSTFARSSTTGRFPRPPLRSPRRP